MKLSEVIENLQKKADQEMEVEYIVVKKDDGQLISCDVGKQAGPMAKLMGMFSNS